MWENPDIERTSGIDQPVHRGAHEPVALAQTVTNEDLSDALFASQFEESLHEIAGFERVQFCARGTTSAARSNANSRNSPRRRGSGSRGAG